MTVIWVKKVDSVNHISPTLDLRELIIDHINRKKTYLIDAY